MIAQRIEVGAVHRPRHLKYHAQAMAVSDAHRHQPGAGERRGDQQSSPGRPADFTKLLGSFLSTSRFAKQQASMADLAVSSRLETWLPLYLASHSAAALQSYFT